MGIRAEESIWFQVPYTAAVHWLLTAVSTPAALGRVIAEQQDPDDYVDPALLRRPELHIAGIAGRDVTPGNFRYLGCADANAHVGLPRMMAEFAGTRRDGRRTKCASRYRDRLFSTRIIGLRHPRLRLSRWRNDRRDGHRRYRAAARRVVMARRRARPRVRSKVMMQRAHWRTCIRAYLPARRYFAHY